MKKLQVITLVLVLLLLSASKALAHAPWQDPPIGTIISDPFEIRPVVEMR